jgi:hypothetical protein
MSDAFDLAILRKEHIVMNLSATVLIGLVLTVIVAGCTRLQLLPGAQPRSKIASEEPVRIPLETCKMTFYFSYLQTLTNVKLEREFDAIEKRFAATADEDDRWRLILFSLLPGQSFSNREDALDLLHGRGQEVSSDNGSQGALGRILVMLLVEQQELERKFNAEKERADKLVKQLDELKEIEKILSERDKK